MTKLLPSIPPGQILKEEFMDPLELNINQLAKSIDVPPNRIHSILCNTRSITADTALRLAKLFGTSARFWLNLQMLYDLEEVEREKGKLINKIIHPLKQLRHKLLYAQ